MARKLTEDFIGTCQWCLGEYKINSSLLVVLHGYKRPGWGHTVGRCVGVDHKPFEYEKTLTEKCIGEMKNDVAKLDEQIADIDAGKVTKVRNPSYIPPEKRAQYRYYGNIEDEFLNSTDKDFPRVLNILRLNTENQKRYIQQVVDYYQLRVDHWTLGKIVGIDTPATGKVREMRDAYNPDEEERKTALAADRAARDAKPGKVTINFYKLGTWPTSDDPDVRRKEIDAFYEREASFKSSVREWTKKTFPGKIWCGDGDDYEVKRILRMSGGYNDDVTRIMCFAAKPEWHYLDQVLAMFPNAHRRDKDSKGKDVRLWVPYDEVLSEGQVADILSGGLYAGALAAGVMTGHPARIKNLADMATKTSIEQKQEDLLQPSQTRINKRAMLLALTMWGEARNHGAEGMRAIGHVVMNRIHSPRHFGKNVKEVVWKRKAFSCWNPNDPNREAMREIAQLPKNSPDYRRWMQAKKIAVDILSGRSRDPTGDALFYHTADVTPSWSEGIKPVSTVANHLFYKVNHKATTV